MPTPADSPLGRDTAYPAHYDSALLFPIARAAGRAAIGLRAPLPFVGHDRWHAYELGWLAPSGVPQMATATITVPADSPNLIESKSFKLYLNSLNAHWLDSREALRQLLQTDLSRAAGAPVGVEFGLPAVQEAGDAVVGIDDEPVVIDRYGPPDPRLLQVHADADADETLVSGLLKSNCPVTGQPDWASVRIAYAGPRIDRSGLLRYLASFRDHADFHEQCVERIFADLMTHCAPRQLSVEARYTRRGGLDINPWRATPGVPPRPRRAMRGSDRAEASSIPP